MPASRPNFPGESQSRRLGTGGGHGSNERLLRTQLVIATLLGFTILAVLLYLLRKPTGTEHDGHDAAVDPSASAAPPAPAIVRTKIEPAKKPVPKVTLGAVQHVKCGASPKLSAPEANLCDALPFFEQGLTKAVTDTADCAPKSKEGGTINFVLAVDFRTHDVRFYPGRSGSWRGKQAKAATECVKRALTLPAWDTISHQYRHYVIAVLATYPPEDAESGLPNFR